MTRFFISTLFFFFLTACTCEYIDPKDTTYVQVILHAKPMALCGHFAFASLTLIKLQNSDTLRVLE